MTKTNSLMTVNTKETSDKINVIDLEETDKNQFKFSCGRPTLAESQEIKNIDTAINNKLQEMTTFVVETFKQGSRYEG